MDEITLLKSEEAEAKERIRATLSALRQDLGAATSPRGWVKERPLSSLLVVGGLGLAVGFGATRKARKLLASRGAKHARPPRGKHVPLARAETDAKAGGGRIAGLAMLAVREALALAFALFRRLLRQVPAADEAPVPASDGAEIVPDAGEGTAAALFGPAMVAGAGSGARAGEK